MRIVDRVFPKLEQPASNNGSGPTMRPETELGARREKLAAELAELQFDLGGLTYEMAIRDHYRLDTLARVAARVQALDAELAEIERLMRMDEAGASGTCSSCGALHSRGAGYCWKCGAELLETASPAGAQPS